MSWFKQAKYRCRVETSQSDLEDLLIQGYNKAIWISNPQAEDVACLDLNEQEWDLESFIFESSFDAPLFSHSHPQCLCKLKVIGEGMEDKWIDWKGVTGQYIMRKAKSKVKEREEEITVGGYSLDKKLLERYIDYVHQLMQRYGESEGYINEEDDQFRSSLHQNLFEDAVTRNNIDPGREGYGAKGVYDAINSYVESVTGFEIISKSNGWFKIAKKEEDTIIGKYRVNTKLLQEYIDFVVKMLKVKGTSITGHELLERMNEKRSELHADLTYDVCVRNKVELYSKENDDIYDVINDYVNDVTGFYAPAVDALIFEESNCGWFKEAMYENLTIQTSDVPQDIKDKIKDIQKQIPEDKFTDKEDEEGWVEKGKQKLFHTTILYGIEEKDIDKIKEIVSKYKPIKVRTTDFETFDKLEDEGYIALVLRVESEDLKKLHDELKSSVVNKDEYSEYKPHITIGYLKEKFEDFKDIKPIEFTVDEVEVCHKDGSREKINLKANKVGWFKIARFSPDLFKRIYTDSIKAIYDERRLEMARKQMLQALERTEGSTPTYENRRKELISNLEVAEVATPELMLAIDAALDYLHYDGLYMAIDEDIHDIEPFLMWKEEFKGEYDFSGLDEEESQMTEEEKSWFPQQQKKEESMNYYELKRIAIEKIAFNLKDELIKQGLKEDSIRGIIGHTVGELYSLGDSRWKELLKDASVKIPETSSKIEWKEPQRKQGWFKKAFKKIVDWFELIPNNINLYRRAEEEGELREEERYIINPNKEKYFSSSETAKEEKEEEAPGDDASTFKAEVPAKPYQSWFSSTMKPIEQQPTPPPIQPPVQVQPTQVQIPPQQPVQPPTTSIPEVKDFYGLTLQTPVTIIDRRNNAISGRGYYRGSTTDGRGVMIGRELEDKNPYLIMMDVYSLKEQKSAQDIVPEGAITAPTAGSNGWFKTAAGESNKIRGIEINQTLLDKYVSYVRYMIEQLQSHPSEERIQDLENERIDIHSELRNDFFNKLENTELPFDEVADEFEKWCDDYLEEVTGWSEYFKDVRTSLKKEIVKEESFKKEESITKQGYLVYSKDITPDLTLSEAREEFLDMYEEEEEYYQEQGVTVEMIMDALASCTEPSHVETLAEIVYGDWDKELGDIATRVKNFKPIPIEDFNKLTGEDIKQAEMHENISPDYAAGELAIEDKPLGVDPTTPLKPEKKKESSIKDGKVRVRGASGGGWVIEKDGSEEFYDNRGKFTRALKEAGCNDGEVCKIFEGSMKDSSYLFSK